MAEKILQRLRYDNDSRRKIVELIGMHSYPLQKESQRQLRRLLGRLGEEQTRRFLELRRADRLGKGTESAAQIEEDTAQLKKLLQEILDRELCFSLKQLKLDGKDLMALGVPQGKGIGLLLNRLLDAVVSGKLENEKDALVRYAQKLLAQREKD